MQMTKDVHTVEGSAIGSLTAPSWRPCSRNKPEVLARRTTWPILLQTGSATVYLQTWSRWPSTKISPASVLWLTLVFCFIYIQWSHYYFTAVKTSVTITCLYINAQDRCNNGIIVLTSAYHFNMRPPGWGLDA